MICLRLTTERLQKLNQIMEKIGVGALKNGDDRSEKLRKFIDSLYENLVMKNSLTVTTEKPHTRKCYMSNYDTVSIKEVCEPCRIKTSQAFLNCPEVNKELGVDR